jgi:GT2 family glycosyltransferase
MISVVIYCDVQHDNPAAELVAAYARQTLPRHLFDVVVADNCNRADLDAAVRHAQEFAPTLNIRYEKLHTIGRAATLNACVRRARHPLIAIMADDALPTPATLESFVNFHRWNLHPLAVAIGPMLFPAALRRDGLRRWLEDSGTLFGVPMRNAFAVWPRTFFYTGCVCLKREAFERIGSFNEIFPWITWDDYEFGTRLMATGGYSQLVAGALSRHEHSLTLDERAGAMRRGGHSAALHERGGASMQPWRTMLEAAARRRDDDIPADDPALPLPLRVARFQLRFDREFLLGYEAEVRGDRSGLVGLRGTT